MALATSMGQEAVDRFLAANVIFGVFDISRTPSQRGVRVAEGRGMLDPAGIEFFSEQYTPDMTDEERRSPAVSPLYADLRGLPPAIFTVGTADHLRSATQHRGVAPGQPQPLGGSTGEASHAPRMTEAGRRLEIGEVAEGFERHIEPIL
jgi:acetyl esterase/lipase